MSENFCIQMIKCNYNLTRNNQTHTLLTWLLQKEEEAWKKRRIHINIHKIIIQNLWSF